MWLVCAAFVVAGCASVPSQTSAISATGEKTVFIIRHLQKGAGPDPSLTPEGAANAQRLAAMLADKHITAIFATPTRRAVQTADPLAKELGIPVTPYDPSDTGALAREVAATSGSVLIVGHSNTVPDLVQLFGGARPAALSELDYGTVFAVGVDHQVTSFGLR